MSNIVILGSTGSIGRSALEVVESLKGEFRVLGLSTNSDIRTLYAQIRRFNPEFAWVRDKKAAALLKSRVKGATLVLSEEEALDRMVRDPRVDRVLLAISGSAALRPLLSSIEAGKTIALANKEALVMAGPLIMRRARLKKAGIIPVDSEQSAIWQCLRSQEPASLERIYLTASGGPLREMSGAQIKKVTLKRVLDHPRWKMGKKITVDSATLMNKGLEMLEAMYLFGVGPEKITVVIHPEAIIHSMVEFRDAVVMAQLSVTDMRIPIQYALTYPKRLNCAFQRLDFLKLKSLNFARPDFAKFPCLGLAYRAAKEGGVSPCVLNAANEVCVEEFLSGGLDFVSIPGIIRGVLDRHKRIVSPGLSEILQADAWARGCARQIIERRMQR